MTTQERIVGQELNSFLHSHLDDLDTPGKVRSLVSYCAGLGMELEAKTALGIAKRFEPDNVQGCRQRIQKALGHGRSEGAAVFRRLRSTVFTSHDFDAFIIDDTGFPKQGERSVGVSRQYCGRLGKVGNCQVAVTLHASSDTRSSMVDAELYLSKEWLTEDHRMDAVIPDDIEHRTKPEMALEMLGRAMDEGAPRRPVLADAAFGDSHAFRQGVAALGLEYAVGVSGKHLVWPADVRFAVPILEPGKIGRPPRRWAPINGEKPVLVRQLGHELVASGLLKPVEWRAGVRNAPDARFGAIRVYCANARTQGHGHPEELWLVVEDRDGQGEQLRYYFLNSPPDTPIQRLVTLMKQRWRIEYDYREMKQFFGLEAYEGRFWGGFHRHLALVALMHAFVSLHREAFPPSRQDDDGSARAGQLVIIPEGTAARPHGLAGALPSLPPAI